MPWRFVDDGDLDVPDMQLLPERGDSAMRIAALGDLLDDERRAVQFTRSLVDVGWGCPSLRWAAERLATELADYQHLLERLAAAYEVTCDDLRRLRCPGQGAAPVGGEGGGGCPVTT